MHCALLQIFLYSLFMHQNHVSEQSWEIVQKVVAVVTHKSIKSQLTSSLHAMINSNSMN